MEAYIARWDQTPRIGAIVGYNTILAAAAALERAGSTETEALVAALKGLDFDSPMGPIHFREIDHQSTMGAWVGTTALKDGGGIMVDWTYMRGEDYLPSDEEVRKLRPQR